MMQVYDPLYGRFTVPDYLDRLVMSPEVRRLSQIRLLNTGSPSLGVLGEIRRYSHTLGVVFLAQQVKLSAYPISDQQAFAAAALAHDIGTPPFGHLLEYYLRERSGWSHESAIRAILWGHHVPENRAHQIYAGRMIEFRSGLRKCGLSLEVFEAIITGQHPLSQLLFGTIDLDNIDNVVRMAWALGIRSQPTIAVNIASALTVRGSKIGLTHEGALADVREWARLRREVYDVLVYDPPTVASQAILSQAIQIALHSDAIDVADPFESDERLIDTLLRFEGTKDTISQEYLGRVLPIQVFAVRVAGTLSELGFRTRAEALAVVEKSLLDIFPGSNPLGYAFVDVSAFERQLRFCLPDGREVVEGNDSQSVVFYGLLRQAEEPSARACRQAVGLFLERLKVTGHQVLTCTLGYRAKYVHVDLPLDLAST